MKENGRTSIAVFNQRRDRLDNQEEEWLQTER